MTLLSSLPGEQRRWQQRDPERFAISELRPAAAIAAYFTRNWSAGWLHEQALCHVHLIEPLI
ncbi:MAG: hypothetical protein AAGG53_13035 [Cyanobacteria bacterium P01_H01_bin.152]